MSFKKLTLLLLLFSVFFLSVYTEETQTEATQEIKSEEALEVNDEAKGAEQGQEQLNPEDLESMLKDLKDGNLNADPEDIKQSEEEMTNEIISELGLDKKETLTKDDFRQFLEKLMSKDFSGNPEEEEFMKFIVDKAVESTPENFSLDELKEFVTSDKLRKILEEAISEKFGINFNDLMGAMSGSMDGLDGGEAIPNLDDLENLKQDGSQESTEGQTEQAEAGAQGGDL